MSRPRIEHIGISVTDLDRSIAWYCTHFGFEKERQFEKTEFEIRGATLRLGESLLEILQPLSPTPGPTAAGTIAAQLRRTGANHFALGVKDVAACFNQLTSENAEIVGELIDARFFFCKDPDGTLIEVRPAG